ncbi:exodeoxyribonuclease III [Nanoarchaeota archaeon]
MNGTKEKPLKIKYGIKNHNNEGRVILLEYKKFILVNVYVPNSGDGLRRLDYRHEWDKDFLSFLKSNDKKKPVIVCGDFNVAHQEIDLARPKPNYNKTAGYTQVEIDGFTNFIENGFVDIHRDMHPKKQEFTFWSYRARARERNVGWRIDYFLVSQRLKNKVKKTFILQDLMGSDHCPLGIKI